MIVFRPPTHADIVHVANHMRDMDRLECEIVAGKGPLEALEESIAQSEWAFAADIEGEVIAIFGVSRESLLSEDGAPWMLGTDGVTRNARLVLQYSRVFRDRMCAEFETLANIVHADNRVAIRYLKWFGFSFGEVIDVKGEPFLPFSMVCAMTKREAA